MLTANLDIRLNPIPSYTCIQRGEGMTIPILHVKNIWKDISPNTVSIRDVSYFSFKEIGE